MQQGARCRCLICCKRPTDCSALNNQYHLSTPRLPCYPGALNAEYKSKLRSLAFNLRDPQNPDLRGHVLTGQISPDQLVRMSAADLANKDLAERRKKIEEEHNKAIELDLETAAKV